mgnify:FL=1
MKGLDNWIMGVNDFTAPFNSHLIINWIDTIHNADCFDVMPEIQKGKVDLILADLPYGTTACKWDSILPFKDMWIEFERLIKPNGVIVLTASQPFTSALVMSNPKMFKYEWIWEKNRGTGFLTAKKIPLKIHENILVFYNKQPTYNPQKTMADENKIDKRKTLNNLPFRKDTVTVKEGYTRIRKADDGTRYPVSVQNFNNSNNVNSLHPTQKPIDLMEYLIKTYTNEGDLVLDCCMGSGTTCLAAKRTGRSYIGIEQDEKYFKIAEQRLNETLL